MHLAHAYARTAGLRIDRMLITEHFYPIGIDEPFVLITTGTGGPAKNYSHYRLAINALKPVLHKGGYKLVQVGGKDDERIGADVDLCGRTSNLQYFGIVARAELVICGDTSALHLAGHYNKKVVALFSVSHPNISGALFGDADKKVYITPENWRPSFNPNENPKTIDSIRPEQIVQAVSNLLSLEAPNFQTVFIGIDNRISLIEVVPNMVVRPDLLPELPINIRFDKGGQEGFIYEQLKYRKSVVVTEQPLNIQHLQMFRQNIEGIIYIIGQNDQPAFAEQLQRNGLPYKLVSFLSESELRPKKLAYIDFHLIERKDKTSRENVTLLDAVTSETRFSSSKRIFSENKAYLSYAHLKNQKALDSLGQSEDTVIDDPMFWEDAHFCHIYNK